MRSRTRPAALTAALLVATLLGSSPAAATERLSVHDATLQLAAGAVGSAELAVQLPALPRRMDVMVLVDVSGSMARQLPVLRRELARAVHGLQARGVDLRAGLAVAGTTPPARNGGSIETPGHNPDPLRDPNDPAYRAPKPFRRLLPVGPVPDFLRSLSGLAPERYPTTAQGGFVANGREQGQLLGLHQLLTGTGFAGSVNDDLQDAVPPGQVAGWRAGTTRVLLDVTDGTFANPEGTPRTATGEPDVALVVRELVDQQVQHIGLVPFGYAPAVDQLAGLSLATRTLVPEPGLRCAGADGSVLLPAGAPLVCSGGPLLLDVAPHARLEVTARATDLLRDVTTGPATVFDTAVPHTAAVRLTVGCPDTSLPGRHEVVVDVSYAGQSATGRLAVTCQAALPGPGGAEAAAHEHPPGAASVGSGPQLAPPAAAPAPPVLAAQPAPAVQPSLTTAARRQEQQALATLVVGMAMTTLLASVWRVRHRDEPVLVGERA
jgi:hypothetical protein